MAKQIKTTKPTTAPKKMIQMTKESKEMKKDMADEAKKRDERQNQPISFKITPPKKK